MNNKKNNIVKIVLVAVVSVITIVCIIFSSSFSSLFSFISNQYNRLEIWRLDSTDLSEVSVNMIKIGSNIQDIDLSVYQNSDRFKKSDGEYTHYFDKLLLNIDNDQVNYLFAFNEDVEININGSKNISKIDEITELLGKNYLEKTQDSEQRLMKHIYKDKKAGIIAEFIYSGYDEQFVWIILRNIR